MSRSLTVDNPVIRSKSRAKRAVYCFSGCWLSLVMDNLETPPQLKSFLESTDFIEMESPCLSEDAVLFFLLNFLDLDETSSIFGSSCIKRYVLQILHLDNAAVRVVELLQKPWTCILLENPVAEYSQPIRLQCCSTCVPLKQYLADILLN